MELIDDLKLIRKYSLKANYIGNTIEIMAKAYFNMDDNEKFKFEMILIDKTNDLDKLPFLSLVFIMLPIIINGLFEKSAWIIGIVLYVAIFICVVICIAIYRRYKLYLQVINKIRDKKIILCKNAENNDYHVEVKI